jgi:hypothetical protein
MPPRSQVSTEVTSEVEEGNISRTKRVIIQRPAGNTDSHIYLGFNSFEGHFEFDKPVELPAAMVDYLRSQRKAEFHPDESGRPMISHVNVINIMDV